MGVAASVLLKGSWYSLEQCGRLLGSAVALYREKDHSTAVGIAMFAHEELGKCRILRAEWKTAVKTGQSPSIEQVKKACEDHIKKQKQGQGGVTLHPASGSALGGAIESAIQNARTPMARASQTADTLIKAAVGAKQKHAPTERHDKRLEGFFVDLEDSGTTWKRPSKTISPEEALNLIRDAANNYDEQRDRFSNPAKFEDWDLAKELDVWKDKPALLPPIWPE
jgi:AbiV family abortive infection protein